MSKQPINFALNEDGILKVIGDFPEQSPKAQAERKKISTQCGHVKRCLQQNERLTGKVLDFVLSVAGEESDIGKKLKAGQPLSDYELHLMLDVYLLHKRLGSR